MTAWSLPLSVEPRGLFRAGRFQDGSDAPIAVFAPVDGTVLATFSGAGGRQADDAVAGAGRAAPMWAALPATERAGLLRTVADEVVHRKDRLATILSAEVGKARAQAEDEVASAVAHLRTCASLAESINGRCAPSGPERRHETAHRPLGTVSVITPWNVPLAMVVRALAAALAAGCPVVVKPSELAPLAVMELFDVVGEVLPADVANLVVGLPASVGSSLVRPPVRKISFTGSAPVGAHLMRSAASHAIPLSLELGGVSHVLVDADADISHAAEQIAVAKLRNAGQACIAPQVVLVHPAARPALLEGLLQTIHATPYTDAAGSHGLGPVINRAAQEKALRHVEDAIARGAVAHEGASPPHHGTFLSAVVIEDPPLESLIRKEEVFAPVLAVATVRDMDSAVQMVNAGPHGLAAYVFSGSARTARRASHALDVGLVGVNTMQVASAGLPFGGTKASGFGAVGGLHGILSFTHPHLTTYGGGW